MFGMPHRRPGRHRRRRLHRRRCNGGGSCSDSMLFWVSDVVRFFFSSSLVPIACICKIDETEENYYIETESFAHVIRIIEIV